MGRDSFLERWEKGEYRYVNVTEVNDYYNYGYTLYSAEYDVNGDGVPEFLIAKEEGGDYVLIGFYAYNGAILSPFGDGGGGFGYRVRLYLCEGGVLCVQGSDSAFSGSAALYRISGDGGSLEQIASYRYDSRDPDAMTYEEVEAALARYPRLDHRSLSWQELAGPAPEEISPEELAEAVLAAADIDESRIIAEAAIYADHVAVDEETVRLRSHIAQLRQMLESGSPVGRKADFLIQEFNREANTIGSKCQNADIAKVVVDLKSEIEKIREQIQNIE